LITLGKLTHDLAGMQRHTYTGVLNITRWNTFCEVCHVSASARQLKVKRKSVRPQTDITDIPDCGLSSQEMSSQGNSKDLAIYQRLVQFVWHCHRRNYESEEIMLNLSYITQYSRMICG